MRKKKPGTEFEKDNFNLWSFWHKEGTEWGKL